MYPCTHLKRRMYTLCMLMVAGFIIMIVDQASVLTCLCFCAAYIQGHFTYLYDIVCIVIAQC